MRVTVCELPHEPEALATAWTALCEHTVRHASELVLLPELAMIDPGIRSSRAATPYPQLAGRSIAATRGHRSHALTKASCAASSAAAMSPSATNSERHTGAYSRSKNASNASTTY